MLKVPVPGAEVAMLGGTLLRQGPSVVPAILKDMRTWLREHEYESVRQMQGSLNHRACPNPGGFERANYMKALQSYK